MISISRSFLLSLGVHAVIVAALLIFGYARIPDETITHTVHVKLSRSTTSVGFSLPAVASGPEDVPRDHRQNWSLPMNDRKSQNESIHPHRFFELTPKVIEIDTNIDYQDISFKELPDILSETNLDPLAGMEGFLPSEENSEDDDFVRNWALSWEDGGERDILTSLEIDGDAFPDTPERLSNIALRIAVSPQGEVLSAEIEAPGSGDIRIDRYLISWALNLVFEPIPPESAVQNGEFRLCFADGDP